MFDAQLTDLAEYDQDRRVCLDQPQIVGVWRSPDKTEVPLYPAGLANLLGPASGN